ncbi:hypothetical protein [Haloterrigena salina]|uniref:hypothetical protein n=1 Tax=Haloterrigena salina TaxID=504937 RepID=UPI0012683E58|nr:hypothetical protein [Haloterrigena salina]
MESDKAKGRRKIHLITSALLFVSASYMLVVGFRGDFSPIFGLEAGFVIIASLLIVAGISFLIKTFYTDI